MTHTPGPWRRGIGSDAHTVFDAQGRIVATHCGYDDGNFIAAAPDMLEALKEIVDANNRNHDRPWSQIIDAARAAIAKATGEEK